MTQTQFILPHPTFNFEEAKKISLYYAKCEENYSMSGLASLFSLERKQLYRYLKVVIIFSLISDENVNMILDKRAVLFAKRYKSQKESLITFEKMLELAEERKKLIKKLDFFNGCFKNNPNADVIKEQCVSRLKEIEKYAFQ